MKSNQTRTTEVISHLKDWGYAALPNVFRAAECARLAEQFNRIESERRNEKTLHIDDQRIMLWDLLLTNPKLFLDKLSNPEILDIAKNVLQETFVLNNFVALRNQGPTPNRNIHIDSRVPIRDFESTIQIVALVCVTDFTIKNGSTYLWPLSHRSGLNPKEMTTKEHPGNIQIEAKAGDVIFFLGQTWHDVAPNLTDDKRWGIVMAYSRWWIKPSFDYTVCSPQTFAMLTPEQKVLLGFTSRPPSSGRTRLNTVMKIEALPTEYETALKS